MLIRRLRLEYFRNIRELDLELAPGRTDIVGTPRPIIIDENTVLTVTDAPGPQVMSSGPIHVRHLRRRGTVPR